MKDLHTLRERELGPGMFCAQHTADDVCDASQTLSQGPA